MSDYSQDLSPLSEFNIEQINQRFGILSNLIRDFLAFIKVDSYIGDGSRARRYTEVGFEPKVIFIWVYITETSEFHLISIISESSKLLVNGFIVDDDGKNVNNNKKSITYNYLALG